MDGTQDPGQQWGNPGGGTAPPPASDNQVSGSTWIAPPPGSGFERTMIIIRIIALVIVLVVFVSIFAIGAYENLHSTTVHTALVTIPSTIGPTYGSGLTTTVAAPQTVTIAGSSTGNGFISAANGTTCNNFSVGARNSHTASGRCAWSGGEVNVTCGLGIQNGATFTLTGANGDTYVSGYATSCSSVCAADINLPAQNYTLTVTGGTGSGYCAGNDYATLSST